MSKVIRLDDETLGTTVNGQFVFAYDWVIRNHFDLKYDLNNYNIDEFVRECKLESIYANSDKKAKVDLMDMIKTDFLSYQELEDWEKLINELEKEYKNNLTD